MKYLFPLYNIFSTIICSFVLFVSFSYAQDLDKKDEESTNPCIIPQGTDIVHFPIQSWYTTPTDLAEFITSVTDFFDPEEDSEEFEKTSYSQFTLAEFIQKNPNSFVFHELATRIYDTRYIESLKQKDASIQSLDQFIEIENPKPEHLFQLVNQQFPEGLPEKYTELDEEQKHTLAIAGGVHTLLFLGELPFIFPSISETYNNKVNDYSEHYCKSYYDIFNICVSSSDLFNMLRADTLAFNVNNFLEAFSTDDEKLIAVLAYRKDDSLQDYFPGKIFYKMPESCTSIKTKNTE